MFAFEGGGAVPLNQRGQRAARLGGADELDGEGVRHVEGIDQQPGETAVAVIDGRVVAASKGAPMSAAEVGSRRQAFDPKVIAGYLDGVPTGKGKVPPAIRHQARLEALIDGGRLGPGNAELSARLDGIVRRGAVPGTAPGRLEVADLTLDLERRDALRGGRRIALQPREFRLLEYLMKHAGQVVTRTMLLENVWDYNFDPQTNVIDVHISRLRQKIEPEPARPSHILTESGVGYRFVAT